MIVIVEVAIDLFDFAGGFLNLGNPWLQLFFAVAIIKPDVFSPTMPTKISKISRQ